MSILNYQKLPFLGQAPLFHKTTLLPFFFLPYYYPQSLPLCVGLFTLLYILLGKSMVPSFLSY